MILPLAGRRHPHQRDRLRRPGQVDRHQRRRRRRQARGGLHRHRPERRRQPRAPEGRPSGAWTTGSTPPTTRSASAGRRTASCASRPAPNGGQWGLASDDDGKPWFVDARRRARPDELPVPDPLRRVHARARRPAAASPACRRRRPAAAAAEIRTARPAWRTASRRTSRSSGRRPGIGDMQGGMGRTRMPARNLNHFTAATGPAIVRGDRLPADLKGDLLFTEPVGRLIRRARDREHRRPDAAAERLSGRPSS